MGDRDINWRHYGRDCRRLGYPIWANPEIGERAATWALGYHEEALRDGRGVIMTPPPQAMKRSRQVKQPAGNRLSSWHQQVVFRRGKQTA